MLKINTTLYPKQINYVYSGIVNFNSHCDVWSICTAPSCVCLVTANSKENETWHNTNITSKFSSVATVFFLIIDLVLTATQLWSNGGYSIAL